MSVLDRRSLLLVLGAAALPLPVIAADPWQKDFSKWSEKDIQKVLNNSPWAREVAVSMGYGSDGGRGRRGRGGDDMNDASAGTSGGMGGAGVGGGNMGGGPGGGGVPSNGDTARLGAANPSVYFLIRWTSAAPIKAALLRAKMAKEDGISPQAKASIEKEEEIYSITMVVPLIGGASGEDADGPGGGSHRKRLAGGDPEAEARLVEATTLSWKSNKSIHPVKVIMPVENSPDFVFHFAKTHPIQLEDNEAEFATRRGSMEIRRKFKLKEMIYNGKLAL